MGHFFYRMYCFENKAVGEEALVDEGNGRMIFILQPYGAVMLPIYVHGGKIRSVRESGKVRKFASSTVRELMNCLKPY
jgi:hypothetical protein